MTMKWTDERTALLTELAGDASVEVSQEAVREIAEKLEVTPRSIGSKLRKMDYTVELASARSKWSTEAETGIRQLLTEQEGKMTYAELAAAFAGGAYTAKEVQGKVLSMEMTNFVKRTPKVETLRTYSEAEEATFIKMAGEGSSIEDIAEALDKSINSVRGKALSLSRQVEGFKTPVQATSHAQTKVDPITSLGDKVAKMTVAEIAEAVGKTERGIKTTLTRRAITCADYDGAKKAAKKAEKAD